MTESRIRELERRFRETGAEEDEMRWLQEAMRIGQISETHLQLLARLGQRSAVSITGVDREDASLQAIRAWADLFVQAPAHCVIWGAVETLSALLDVQQSGSRIDDLLSETVEVCRDWIKAPFAENRRRVDLVQLRLQNSLDSRAIDEHCPYDDLPNQPAEADCDALRAAIRLCKIIIHQEFDPNEVSEHLFLTGANAISLRLPNGGIVIHPQRRLMYIAQAADLMRRPLIAGLTQGLCK